MSTGRLAVGYEGQAIDGQVARQAISDLIGQEYLDLWANLMDIPPDAQIPDYIDDLLVAAAYRQHVKDRAE